MLPIENELLVDAAQLALDLIGIFEPTPFADGSNALISLFRGRVLEGALSAVSMIPYIGDLAKLGKLPRYVKSIGRAINLANKNLRFASELYLHLKQVKKALDLIPWDKIPKTAKGPLQEIQGMVNGFLTRYPRVLENAFPFRNVQFHGLARNKKLVEMTDMEIKNAFARIGIREPKGAKKAHFFQRLKTRGAEMGLHTPQDVANALRDGHILPGKEAGWVDLELPGGRGIIGMTTEFEFMTAGRR